MSLSVNTNVASLTAQNALNSAQNALDTSLQRLSTGSQINSAADNPAGLVTSSLQAAQISGLQQSLSNIATSTNLAQTADSSLSNINALLVQIRTLASNSANSATQSAASLAANNTAAAALVSSITTIADSTAFGSVNLLDGTFTGGQFQIGADSADGSATNAADNVVTSFSLGAADATGLSLTSISLTSGTAASTALNTIDTAIASVATERGTIGSFIAGTLAATATNNQSELTNLQSAQSTLVDTNYQTEIANYTSENIKQQAASTVLGFANQSNSSILDLLKNA